MKPRTKLQHKLVEYSNWLTPGVEKKILQYAYSNCNSKYGFSTGKTYWCGLCGDTHSAKEIVSNEVTCISCDSELHIIETKKRKFYESYYIAFAEDMFEYQVIRYFYVTTNYRKGESWKTNVLECIQQFHTNHDFYLIGRLTQGHGDPLYGQMEFRNPSYYSQFAYNPWPSAYHPDSTFLPEYQKKGCVGDFGNVRFYDLKKHLNWDCPKTETLLKAKATELLKVALRDSNKIARYWDTVKICLRNNYQPHDGGMYIDYVELLERFGKDLRNSKYVCPANLKEEHDRYVKKAKLHQKKIDLKNQIRQKAIDDEAYQKAKSIYFDLIFRSNNLVIEPLKSIDDFIKESEVHKHCVYSNKYYNKQNSLILSAKVNNQRVETIEIDIEQLEVIQSRGLQNQASKFNKQILELLNNNLHQIAQVKNNLSQTA
ncbi:PcfJ domain-containing protein [Flavobacterium agricola]|uniref:PcfJ domain-containing protein n=1 Tax=Flavobacterium agricola TaxID=2870839 RepID=A0ABY6LZN3_9FLAO|nr:PcfJ domain-containing protein [Flavobacterium agricola]UYW01775.1 PcfJ domain-containing protein [Flavobacterium agricola]